MTASVPGGSNHEVTPRAGQGARFPRTARLLRHADFERVYKQGRRHFSASMTVFYWQRPEADHGRSEDASALGAAHRIHGEPRAGRRGAAQPDEAPFARSGSADASSGRRAVRTS